MQLLPFGNPGRLYFCTGEVVTCRVKMDTKIWCRWTSEARTKPGHWDSRAGIASGAARRRKRSMREAADYYLSLPETDRRRVNAMLRDAIDPEDIDNQMAVVMGVTERAKRGDPQAASVLLKMLGEDTVQEDPAADALAKAKELLGGVDSAID